MCHVNSRGFTLIEVLVALAITASVAVIAYSGLSSALVARDRLIAEETSLREIQRFFNLIGRDLRHVVGRTVVDENGERQAALRGEHGALLRLALTRSGWDNFNGSPRSNMQRVSWWLEDGVVHRGYYAVLDRAGEQPLLEATVLEGVEELEFRYLRSSAASSAESSAQDSDDDAWQPVWPGSDGRADTLPRAIEVSVETKELGRATRLFLPAN